MVQAALLLNLANKSNFAKAAATTQGSPTTEPSVNVTSLNHKESKYLLLLFPWAIINIPQAPNWPKSGTGTTNNKSRSKKRTQARKKGRRRTLANDPNPPITKPAVAHTPAKSDKRANVASSVKENAKPPNANLLEINPSKLRIRPPPASVSRSPVKPKLSLSQAEKACEGVKGNIQRVQGKTFLTFCLLIP